MAAFAPPNQLLYLRDTTLTAHQFDPDRLELIGDALPVAGQVIINASSGAASFSVSGTGNWLTARELM
jgi:hypothetical protein